MISPPSCLIHAVMLSLLGSLILPSALSQNTLKLDGVVVTCSGIDKAHAAAIAKLVKDAREATRRIGLAMPETINVTIDLGQSLFLRNDQQNGIQHTIRSQKDLSPTVACQVYGYCHEVAHLAMFRQMNFRECQGFTTDAFGEGWAHYLGCRLVDEVYEKEGESLWPEPYDYRREGTNRLKRALSSSTRPDPETRGAALWMELAPLLPESNFPALFAAWGRVDCEATDLGKVLYELSDGDPKVGAWWRKAAPVFLKVY